MSALSNKHTDEPEANCPLLLCAIHLIDGNLSLQHLLYDVEFQY